MFFSALFNHIFAPTRQEAIFGAAMVNGCLFISWQNSDLYILKSTTPKEQNRDYSSNQCLDLKNIKSQPKFDSGRYKLKLVVPR